MRFSASAPLRIDNSPQARKGDGFDRTAFTIDWDSQQVTCPQGVKNTIWSQSRERNRDVIVVRFDVTDCRPCPVRPQCTRSTRNGRQLMLRPPAIHAVVEQAREEQETDAWKQRYAVRAGVEGTIHQAVAVVGGPPLPLHRPAQDTPRSSRCCGCSEPDPAGRLVDRHATRPTSQPSHQA
jgi:hypothetical protein